MTQDRGSWTLKGDSTLFGEIGQLFKSLESLLGGEGVNQLLKTVTLIAAWHAELGLLLAPVTSL